MSLAVAVTPAQGEDILLEVSVDGGTTWLKVFCLIKQGFDAARNVNKTNTQCGQLIGKGTLDFSIPVEGAVNVAVVAGYASYKQMQSWIDSFTALMARQKAPTSTGADFYNGINCYLTDLKLDMPVDNIATFSGTLTGYGTWVTVAP